MITTRKAAALAAIAVTAGGLAACGTTVAKAPAGAPTAFTPATSPAAPSAVGAVKGSGNNKYVTGPFTVTMTAGMVRLPSRFDSTTESGQDIPEYGSVIVVKDTSATFAGWVGPQVEYVKGHSLRGQIVDTEAADPEAGGYGGQSDNLAPGQSETLYAQYSGTVTGYIDAQLTTVNYGATGTPGLSATIVHLKY
jgi:hypothetical protein